MCLILFAYRAVPGYRLIVAANRDEFYARPTAPLHRWPENPRIIAGRDLQAGGTWLGVTETGLFAAVTNYREGASPPDGAHSRGAILEEFFRGERGAGEFVDDLQRRGGNYRGYNLLAGDGLSLCYCSNRGGAPQELPGGIYALSNGLLSSRWPKQVRGRKRFAVALRRQSLKKDDFFSLLCDTNQPADEELPETGMSRDWERLLAPIFIRSPRYGTRSQALLCIGDDGSSCFRERTCEAGCETGWPEREVRFTIKEECREGPQRR